ncbi:MAG: SRPBCC family protein [Actinomycetota bacterium]|nr:SRPBCC family protein [Actinomycetota bacterium]
MAEPNKRTNERGRGLARGLGLFSLALGTAQVLAPQRVARRVGLDDTATTRDVMRLVGIRELAVVPGLLAGPAPRGWLLARVGGDVMDLALLGRALDRKRGADRDMATAAVAAVAGVTALDLLAVRRTRRPATLHLTAAITVRKPSMDVYRYWRDVENLPTFMYHLESVTPGNGGRSHWIARAPLWRRLEWDAEVTDDIPGERLAWRSVGKTLVPNRGEVSFTPAPGDRGTEVRVHLDYSLPAGRVGAKVARLLGEEPHQQVEDDLRRFKQVLEAGEVVRSDATPEGTAALRHLVQRPGQPVGKR